MRAHGGRSSGMIEPYGVEPVAGVAGPSRRAATLGSPTPTPTPARRVRTASGRRSRARWGARSVGMIARLDTGPGAGSEGDDDARGGPGDQPRSRARARRRRTTDDGEG